MVETPTWENVAVVHPTHADPAALLRDDVRGPRIVAKTIYRMLRIRGLPSRQLLRVATELLGLISDDLRAR